MKKIKYKKYERTDSRTFYFDLRLDFSKHYETLDTTEYFTINKINNKYYIEFYKHKSRDYKLPENNSKEINNKEYLLSFLLLFRV